MKTLVSIGSRFCGPPGTGNGGYCAGVAAAGMEMEMDGAIEVTLRRPLPIERALRMEHGDGVRLFDGEHLLLEARPADLALDAPDGPSFADAETMSRGFSGFESHPFPACFVCGSARAHGDGLRIFAGGTDDGGLVGAPWIPDHTLADNGGRVRPEFLWAALDCPGYFAIARGGEKAVLGRIVADVDPTVTPGERCVVVGWPVGRSGRKLQAGTALYDESGTRRGVSLQTWITI
jgi:hypothetical protein